MVGIELASRGEGSLGAQGGRNRHKATCRGPSPAWGRDLPARAIFSPLARTRIGHRSLIDGLDQADRTTRDRLETHVAKTIQPPGTDEPAEEPKEYGKSGKHFHRARLRQRAKQSRFSSCVKGRWTVIRLLEWRIRMADRGALRCWGVLGADDLDRPHRGVFRPLTRRRMAGLLWWGSGLLDQRISALLEQGHVFRSRLSGRGFGIHERDRLHERECKNCAGRKSHRRTS